MRGPRAWRAACRHAIAITDRRVCLPLCPVFPRVPRPGRRRASSRLGCQVCVTKELDGLRATLPPGKSTLYSTTRGRICASHSAAGGLTLSALLFTCVSLSRLSLSIWNSHKKHERRRLRTQAALAHEAARWSCFQVLWSRQAALVSNKRRRNIRRHSTPRLCWPWATDYANRLSRPALAVLFAPALHYVYKYCVRVAYGTGYEHKDASTRAWP